MKVGDKVYLACLSSLGVTSEGWDFIKETQVKYDEDTGEPYNIVLVGSSWYDERDGSPYSNGQSFYYITPES